MQASQASSDAPPPPTAEYLGVNGELEAAEKLILRWDSTASASSSAADDRMLFDGDRSEAEKYLLAVDEIRRSIKDPIAFIGSPRRLSSGSSSSTTTPENALQIAMARLEDEFRHLLQTRSHEIDIESLVDLSSLSLQIPALGSGEFSDAEGVGEEGVEEGAEEGLPLPAAAGDTVGATGSSHGSSRLRRSSYGSNRSIREIELLPEDVVQDLRNIAERMIASGYGRECIQVYGGARKAAVELCFRQLGIERLSIGDVQRLEWATLEAKIRSWIRSVRVCVRIVFASERRLCERVFDGISSDDASFMEAVKGAAFQLFSFAEAISISRRLPEKLFKILDLYDTIADLLPDIAAVFRSTSSESIFTQANEILSRLAEAVRGILSEFQNAVFRDPSRTPVPGGTIHPLTRYVMNYLGLMSEYKPTLIKLIVTKPSGIFRISSDDPSAANAVPSPEVDFPEAEDQTPLVSHFMWIIAVLVHNIENKANLYKDPALFHLFLMNNVHYIVHKVKDSPELREMISIEYLKKLTGKYQQSATSYQRATWIKILHFLREEGLHVGGSFSSGVSKSTLRERFRAFNAAFEEVHRIQAIWSVPDMQLREELRISISEKLLAAYRSFLGRFRQHIESGRHPEMYIKYSVEDLEIALADFFEASPPPSLGKRRSY